VSLVRATQHLSTEDLAKWRAQAPTVKSKPGSRRFDEPDPDELEAPSPQGRLKPRETYDALLERAFGGPEGRAAAVKALRAMYPSVVAHLTEAQIADKVDELIRDSVERNARARNMWGPITVPGHLGGRG
jgi:hypothetical protein